MLFALHGGFVCALLGVRVERSTCEARAYESMELAANPKPIPGSSAFSAYLRIIEWRV
jgi:hypothetical protein